MDHLAQVLDAFYMQLYAFSSPARHILSCNLVIFLLWSF